MSEEHTLTGTIYCPKCGFKFTVENKRLMECHICGKNVYGEYPRLEVTLCPEEYKPKQKFGYICKECASKLKLTKKKSLKESERMEKQ